MSPFLLPVAVRQDTNSVRELFNTCISRPVKHPWSNLSQSFRMQPTHPAQCAVYNCIQHESAIKSRDGVSNQHATMSHRTFSASIRNCIDFLFVDSA